MSNLVWGRGDDAQQPLPDIPAMAKSPSGVPRVLAMGGEHGLQDREGWYNSKVEEMRAVRDKLRNARRMAAASELSASKGAMGAGAFGRRGMVQAQAPPGRVQRDHPPTGRPQQLRPATAGRDRSDRPFLPTPDHREIDWRVDGDPPPALTDHMREGGGTRERSPTGGALQARSPSKPRWSIPQRGLHDNERVTAREAPPPPLSPSLSLTLAVSLSVSFSLFSLSLARARTHTHTHTLSCLSVSLS